MLWDEWDRQEEAPSASPPPDRPDPEYETPHPASKTAPMVDETPQTPPRDARPVGRRAPGCLLPCGLGCLMMLLAVAAVVLPVMWYTAKHLETRTATKQAELGTRLEALAASPHLTAEDEEVLERLVGCLHGPATGYLGLVLIEVALDACVEDGRIDPEQRNRLEATAAFLARHPAPNPREMERFLSNHPELEERLDGLPPAP